MDICETEQAYHLEMDLPGVRRENLHVEDIGDQLMILGGRLQTKASEKYYLRIERDFGQFERRVRLMMPIKKDRIKARYQDGVLRIIVPKTESAKTRRIPVKS